MTDPRGEVAGRGDVSELDEMLKLAREMKSNEPTLVRIEFGGPPAKAWIEANFSANAGPLGPILGTPVYPSDQILPEMIRAIMSDGSSQVFNTATGKGFTVLPHDFLKNMIKPLFSTEAPPQEPEA